MVVARAAESKGVAAKGAAATKVAKGVAAKALEGVALHLRFDAMAQPVVNEGEVGRPRRAGSSGGRRGAAGPDAPLAARHFAALVRRGAAASFLGSTS